MKKILGVLFMVGLCIVGHAQQYEMQIDFGVRSSLNNVQCYSNVDMRINHVTGSYWRWYQGFNMGQGTWQYFTRTIAFDATDKVKSIDVYSDRVIDQNVGGCKSLGGGNINIPIPDSSYPCSTPITVYGIPGYDPDTYITVTIRPLTSVYVIETEATVVANRDYIELDYVISLKYSDNSIETVSSAAFRTFGNGQKGISRQAIIKPNRNLRVTEIQVRTIYMYFSGIFPKFVDQTQINTVSDTNADFDVTLTNPFFDSGSGGSLRVFFGQVNTPVSGPTDHILPSENNVTLSIPELIPENYSSYVWQYDNGSGFQNFPPGLGNTKTVTFDGQSLLGANYENYFFKNILVRAAYCGRYSETFTLRHVPSAPGIVSIEPAAETCYGKHDAKLKITFDRPLYTSMDEEITIFPNGLISQEFANLTLDAANSVTVQSTVLSPGAYNISLIDKFVSTGETGYSNGPTHFASTTVPPRLPITNFSATPSDAHCNGGQDGRIAVSAQGGTSSYTAFLHQDTTDLGNINLTEATGNSFTDLAANTYTVTLKDSNGCDPKDGSGNVIQLSAPVGQPAQQLSLSAVDNVEPLGFGLTNGYVSASAQGGTISYNFAWTDAVNNSLTPDAPVQQGATTLSKLSNIGKGVYYVRAEDANYVLASPAIEINQRGCYDTLSFNVIQPPLLEVAMAEQHFVSCYNYKDGELVAHAKGGRPYLTGQYQPYMYEWFVVSSPLTAFGTSDSTQLDRFSATYRVKVTDRNGIIAWSPDFLLVQPDPLVIGFNTSQLLCNGDSNGTSTALPTGGTTPYSYQWSTDDITQSVNNLTDGFYSVVVQDSRKCTTYDQTEVTVPNSLIVSPQVKQPTCNNYSDGSIQLNAGGGKPGYTYAWQRGDSTDLIQNLGQGSYEVKVTDANGCFIVKDFTLDNPGLLPVNLGPDRVLCKDQTLPLDVSVADPLATYTWTKDGLTFSSAASVALYDPATYVARVSDSNGCVNQDDITISRDETEIASDFVVATRLPKDQRVRITNISFPYPDNVEWIIPVQAQVKDQKPEYVELIFSDYGQYNVGLKSHKGQCEKITMQTVNDVTDAELADYQAPDEPYIKQFLVSPNPNKGKFTALVQLREVGDYKLVFYSPQEMLISDKEVKGYSFATTDFDVSAQVSTGVYVLELITTQGLSYIKILIQ